MNCTECRDFLASYIEQLLDESQTQAVDQHLESCPSCREELEGLETLRNRLAGNGKALASVSVEEDVMNRIIREQNVRLKAAAQASAGLRIRRFLMNSTTRRFAVAAAVVLVAVLGYSIFFSGSTASAYAQVVNRLQKAQTMTFSIITQTGMETVQTVRTDIALKEPGHMRLSTPDGYICVADTTNDRIEGIVLVPTTRMYMNLDIDNLPTDKDSGTFMSVEKLRTLPAEADELLGAAKIDGQTLEGFRVHDGDATATVWVQPATGELARAEVEFANAPGMNTIMTDFQFDIPLDDALFSLEPPAGYELMNIEADASQVTEDDFIAYLRLWSRWTVDGTFPPIIQGTEIAKITVDMAHEGKFVGPVAPGYEGGQQQQIMFDGMLFASTLPAGSFRYAGQNVPYGDPTTPIFWYRPAGSPTWRIIYADLHTADVTPEDLPQ